MFFQLYSVSYSVEYRGPYRGLVVKVKVCVVEPGNHIAGTGIQDPERVAKETTSMWDALDDQMRCDYGEKRLAECIDLNKKFVTCGVSCFYPLKAALIKNELWLVFFSNPCYYW